MTKPKGRPAGKTPQLTEVFTRVTSEEKKKLQEAHKQYNKDNGLKLSFSAFLAKKLEQQDVEAEKPLTLTEQTYQDNTFWALVEKKGLESVHGRSFIHPVTVGSGVGRNSAGEQVASFTRNIQFVIPYISNHSIAEISAENILAVSGNSQALEMIKQMAFDNALNNLSLSHVEDLYDGTGVSSKLSGLAAWLPVGGPSDDHFHGVNRTVDAVRLAGNWLDGTQMSVEDTIIKGSSMVAHQGGKIDTILLSFPKFAQLLMGQSVKVMIQKEVVPGILLDGLEIILPTGKATVYPDRNCPEDRVYGLNMQTWKYVHVGPEAILQRDLDGEEWNLTADKSLFTGVFTMGNLVCLQPSYNFVASVCA